MGLLVNGEWRDRWYDTKSTGGEFVREDSKFRGWITPDGGPGPDERPGFKAEPGRYHLYVSYACPWAHRSLIFRKLKCLEDKISVSAVHPHMLENGWEFKVDESFGTGPDLLYGLNYLYELYVKTKPDYTGRVTVPVLWDKHQETIVNNESAEIIRMLNGSFDACGAREVDYYPSEYREAIDTINNEVYNNINNGVYRSGFATTQAAYERAFESLFSSLEKIEGILSRQRYLAGPELTEADWRLFTTLVRFDTVYYSHFKCNRRRIADFDNLSNYLRELYQHPGIAETVHFDHIKHHYYYSHANINPTRIVPVGPELDLNRPHNRGS